MKVFSITVCVILAAVMLIASTITGKNEPLSHRVVQMVAGVSMIFVTLHVAGVLQ